MSRFTLAVAFVALAAVAVAQDEWKPPPPRLLDKARGPATKASTPAKDATKADDKAEKPAGGMSPFVGLLIGIAIGLAGFAVYKFVVEPRRKRRPLLAALEIIARDERGLFP